MIPIYIINLPHRRDRLQRITTQLKSFGLSYQVVHAIQHDDGAYGLRLTMAMLFQQLSQPGGPALALILEDDCEFLQNPAPLIEKALAELPVNFGLLFLGGNVYKPAKPYSEHLYSLVACVGNHAVVYTRKAMEDMAFWYGQETEPTDMILDRMVVRHGNCYTTNPLLATQYASYSDIEKKETDYSNLLIDRYHKHVS